jgi:nucleotide-binding universal stress UspA family protein
MSIRHILAPTDFTETSTRAVELALELGRSLAADVTLLHAYEIPIVGFPDGALVATAEVAGRIADVSRTALEAAVDRYKDRGVPVAGMLREGVVYEEIEHAAEEIDADLIVIGTHGRRGIARALLGSVAENVIRTCARPVLTVHGPHA